MSAKKWYREYYVLPGSFEPADCIVTAVAFKKDGSAYLALVIGRDDVTVRVNVPVKRKEAKRVAKAIRAAVKANAVMQVQK